MCVYGKSFETYCYKGYFLNGILYSNSDSIEVLVGFVQV